MGLASKIAAGQAGQAGQAGSSAQSRPPQAQQAPPAMNYYGQPQQYQAYSNPSYPGGYSQPYQAQPAARPPSQAPTQQLQPTQAGGAIGNEEHFFNILKEAVNENHLHQFYSDEQLRKIARKIVIDGRDPVGQLCRAWDVPLEIGFDLVKQALYDVVFLLDDSGSIIFNKLNHELREILQAAAFATSLFDDDGFSVRFMNSDLRADNIRSEQEAVALVDRMEYKNQTPLASATKHKVLDPFVNQPYQSGQLRKPVHVIIITDGRPTDSWHGEFQKYIKETAERFKVTDSSGKQVYSRVVAFQIAQVGHDPAAQEYLATLDQDSYVGKLIDCTSNFELESEEYSRKGITITRYHWYTKLMMGAIDRSYDENDEATKGELSAVPSQANYKPQQYGGAAGQGQQAYSQPQQQQQPQQYGGYQPYGQHPQQSHQPLTQQYPAQYGGQAPYPQAPLYAQQQPLAQQAPQSYGQSPQPYGQSPQSYGQPYGQPSQYGQQYPQQQPPKLGQQPPKITQGSIGSYNPTNTPPVAYTPNSGYNH